MKLKIFNIFTLILLLIVGCSEDDNGPTAPGNDDSGNTNGTCTSSIVTFETEYYPGSGAMSYYPSATCEGSSSTGWCDNPLIPSTQEECNGSYGEYSCTIKNQSWRFHEDCTFTWSALGEVAGIWSDNLNGLAITSYDLCITDEISTIMTQEECINAAYTEDISELDCSNQGGSWNGENCTMVGGFWISGSTSQIGVDLLTEITYDDACVAVTLQTTPIECENNVPINNGDTTDCDNCLATCVPLALNNGASDEDAAVYWCNSTPSNQYGCSDICVDGGEGSPFDCLNDCDSLETITGDPEEIGQTEYCNTLMAVNQSCWSDCSSEVTDFISMFITQCEICLPAEMCECCFVENGPEGCSEFSCSGEEDEDSSGPNGPYCLQLIAYHEDENPDCYNQTTQDVSALLGCDQYTIDFSSDTFTAGSGLHFENGSWEINNDLQITGIEIEGLGIGVSISINYDDQLNRLEIYEAYDGSDPASSTGDTPYCNLSIFLDPNNP